MLLFNAEALGRDAQRQCRGWWHEIAEKIADRFRVVIDVHANEREGLRGAIKSVSEHLSDGKLRVYRQPHGRETNGRRLRKVAAKDCYVTVSGMRWRWIHSINAACISERVARQDTLRRRVGEWAPSVRDLYWQCFCGGPNAA